MAPALTMQQLAMAVDEIADSIYELETEHGFAIQQLAAVGAACEASGPMSAELQTRCRDLGSEVHANMLGLLPPIVSISQLSLLYSQPADVIIKICAEVIAAGASLTVERLEEAVSEISSTFDELKRVHQLSNRVEAVVPVQTVAAYIGQLSILTRDILNFILNRMTRLKLAMLSIHELSEEYSQHAKVVIEASGGVLRGLHATETNGAP